MTQRVRKIEYRTPASLTRYERNARVHSDAQVDHIAALIDQFGFVSPILIQSDGEIIAGHGRLAAAEKLGLEKVPCVVVNGLTEAQVRLYRIADNRAAEQGVAWDYDLIKLEYEAIGGEVDIELGGFDPEWVMGLGSEQYEPELEPQTGAGQVTDGDVDRAQDRETERFNGGGDTGMEVVCPSCGAEFSVRGDG